MIFLSAAVSQYVSIYIKYILPDLYLQPKCGLLQANQAGKSWGVVRIVGAYYGGLKRLSGGSGFGWDLNYMGLMGREILMEMRVKMKKAN